jgi:hypothetical protein
MTATLKKLLSALGLLTLITVAFFFAVWTLMKDPDSYDITIFVLGFLGGGWFFFREEQSLWPRIQGLFGWLVSGLAATALTAMILWIGMDSWFTNIGLGAGAILTGMAVVDFYLGLMGEGIRSIPDLWR